MAYVITEPCIGTKDTACVDVCPVDCIHPRKDEPAFEAAKMLNIHPDECIDCGACVPACPVEAIFALDEVPGQVEGLHPGQRGVLQEVGRAGSAASWSPATSTSIARRGRGCAPRRR